MEDKLKKDLIIETIKGEKHLGERLKQILIEFIMERIEVNNEPYINIIDEKFKKNMQELEEIDTDDLIIYHLLDPKKRETKEILNSSLAEKINKIIKKVNEIDEKLKEIK